MSIDAMKQALEALDSACHGYVTGGLPKVQQAITALRAAIEQAQEPVASDPLLDALTDELIGMTDEQVLAGEDPALVLAYGRDLLAKARADANKNLCPLENRIHALVEIAALARAKTPRR